LAFSHKQEDMMSKSNLSRRTLVSSAVALPAMAITTGVAGPAFAQISSDHPDAELLRLGGKLAVVEQERAAQMAIDRRRTATVDAEVERRTGIAVCDAPKTFDESCESGYQAIHDQVFREVCGLDPDDEDEDGNAKWDRIFDQLYPISNAILALRATTTDGLKIQARAAVLARAELWDDGLARDDDHERLFIEATCSFLGLDGRRIAKGSGESQLPSGNAA
jgi:hypothetical protein